MHVSPPVPAALEPDPTMQLLVHCQRALLSLAALAFLLPSLALGQGLTTSALNGRVVDNSGGPVAGASVTAVHLPSGTRASTVTRENGGYNLTGLRPGGPYTVSASKDGFQTRAVEGVFVLLEETATVDVVVVPEVIRLDTMEVTAGSDTIFGSGAMGTGMNLDNAALNQVPGTGRSLQEVISRSAFATFMDRERGEVNALGQNLRFNSLLVNGVPTNDPFGLQPSGLPAQRNTLSIETIEAINIDVAPYDVRRAGFTGALVNAVTKSGTNDFRGSVYYYYTDDRLRGDDPRAFSDPTRGGAPNTSIDPSPEFTDETWGFTFGGPILKDRLFFFVGYEEFERETVPTTSFFIPDPAAISQIQARARALGYEPGEIVAPGTNTQTDKQYSVRLDWNISDDHRAVASWRRNESLDPDFPGNTTTSASFSNYWFDRSVSNDAYSLQVFSNWSPSFRTEASVSFSQYESVRDNRGEPFPEVEIRGVPAAGITSPNPTTSSHWGSVFLGTERSSQINELFTDTWTSSLVGEWFVGDHTLTFGYDSESYDIFNEFLQDRYGRWQFGRNASGGSLSALNGFPAVGSNAASPGTPMWVAGLIGPGSSYGAQRPVPGSSGITLDGTPLGDQTSAADWSYTMYGVFLQDRWKFNEALTLMGGVRLDYPVSDAPLYAGELRSGSTIIRRDFESVFGRRNDASMDGNALVSPRFGFNYDFSTESTQRQLRGGYGLFQGRSPAVWMSNGFSLNGIAVQTTTALPTNATPFPDGGLPAPFGTAAPRYNVSLMSEKFRMPSVWRGNLALDHELPWGGLVATVEVVRTDSENALHYEHLNLNQLVRTSGNQLVTAPDGRPLYAGVGLTSNAGLRSQSFAPISGQSGFSTAAGRQREAGYNDVVLVTNTSGGESTAVSFGINRPMQDGWAGGISYTWTRATEVSPLTSSVALSNWQNRAVFDPNENVASRSNYEVRDRINASITREFSVFEKFITAVTLSYEGRTNRPYSWTFVGDANGDNISGNDLFYVPTGPSDPRVRFSGGTTMANAFFAYVDSQGGLNEYRGQVVPRNSETSPFSHQFDIRVTQDLPIWRTLKTQLIVDLINVGNMIDKSWGRVEQMGFPFSRRVASATFDPAANGGAGQWVYNFTSPDAVPVRVGQAQGGIAESRWAVQLGVRVTF